MLFYAILLAACTPRPPVQTEPSSPHAGLNLSDPAACAGCHTDTVAQWKQSMHSRAHQDNDPIFAAMRSMRMKKQGEQIAKKCASCHDPLAQKGEVAAHGVTCGACHALHDTEITKPADGKTVCLTCHNAGKNPNGAPTCTTGPENDAAGGPACASCHMKDGAHTFRGPHRAWYEDDPSMLKEALTVKLTKTDAGATLTVTNATGHAFPTGFPGRLASIQVIGAGPLKITPPALLFRKVYVDADGKPTMPPMAAALKDDTRLKPAETRTVTLDVPEGATELKAQLVFHLLPPPAAAKLKLSDRPEGKPVVVELATLTL